MARSSRGNEAHSTSEFCAEIRASLPRLLLFQRAAKRARAGFTLAEVLAALAFMAIVIPVAVEGVRIANLAGQVGQRKAAAVRVAERVLHESLLAGQSRGAAQRGVTQEGLQAYRWSLRSEPWTEDSMKLVTVQVLFPVQGRDYDVHLSTLVSSSSP